MNRLVESLLYKYSYLALPKQSSHDCDKTIVEQWLMILLSNPSVSPVISPISERPYKGMNHDEKTRIMFAFPNISVIGLR